jgi:hypothetical protein
LATRDGSPFRDKALRKRSAARQGPKVCELEGPTPTLNISNTLIDSIGLVFYGLKGSKKNGKILDYIKKVAGRSSAGRPVLDSLHPASKYK